MATSSGADKTPQRSKVYVPNPLEAAGDDIEIVTHITIPTEGGWGWVVVASSYYCIFTVDGILTTFGSLFTDIRDDLKVEESLIALINSVTFATCFFVGPIASAVINRYGFRECAIAGSITCSLALLFTYFMTEYSMVILFYGFVNGFGISFINLSASLVVGFYFDRLRAVALSIALSGSSFGCMIMYTVNSALVKIAGWRIVTLIHSGMFALVFFFGLTFRPLTPVLVTTTDEPSTVYTSLPNITSANKAGVQRMFKAVSNANFPTTANIVNKGIVTDSLAKPSVSDKKIPKYTLSTIGPSIDERQLKKMQSVQNQPGRTRARSVDVTIAIAPPKKQKFWARLCQWQKHAPESRPMYRDDVFYSGKVDDLPTYKKSVMATDSKDRFAIEYHMAVTRAAAVDDIAEKNIICSTAMRRVLATMIDPNLLKKASFLMISFSAFFVYLGAYVPYVFLQDRNQLEGIDPMHCSSIISFIGLTNIIGRLILGALACKISPIKLYVVAVFVSGMGTMAFNFSFNVYYQYVCAGVFGFFISCLVSLRSMIIVDLYGLENLTNCTGLMFLFQGLGCLISTPLSMIIKTNFGYALSFYTAGAFLLISTTFMILLRKVRNRELSSVKTGERPKK